MNKHLKNLFTGLVAVFLLIVIVMNIGIIFHVLMFLGVCYFFFTVIMWIGKKANSKLLKITKKKEN